jgi:hypothetical protein
MKQISPAVGRTVAIRRDEQHKQLGPGSTAEYGYGAGSTAIIGVENAAAWYFVTVERGFASREMGSHLVY